MRRVWVATSCGIAYITFSVGTWGGTRGENRPGKKLGGAELLREEAEEAAYAEVADEIRVTML